MKNAKCPYHNLDMAISSEDFLGNKKIIGQCPKCEKIKYIFMPGMLNSIVMDGIRYCHSDVMSDAIINYEKEKDTGNGVPKKDLTLPSEQKGKIFESSDSEKRYNFPISISNKKKPDIIFTQSTNLTIVEKMPKNCLTDWHSLFNVCVSGLGNIQTLMYCDKCNTIYKAKNGRY